MSLAWLRLCSYLLGSRSPPGDDEQWIQFVSRQDYGRHGAGHDAGRHASGAETCRPVRPRLAFESSSLYGEHMT